MSSEWPMVTLADAPLLIMDGDRGTNYPSQNDFSPSGHCLFLNTGNVTTEGFNFSNCAFVTSEKDSALRKGKLDRGDIVLTTRGTVGNVGFFSDAVPFENVRINSGMVILRPDQQLISSYFLYLFVRSTLFMKQVRSLQSGSAQPQLPIRDMKRIEIPIPPLQEQSAICAVLGSLDDRISLLRETNTTLESIAQALFKSWFVDFDPVRAKQQGNSPQGMDAATAALFPDSFEESELGEVPMGWRILPLNQLCKISSGKRPNVRSDAETSAAAIPLFGGAGKMGFTNESLFEIPQIVTGRVGTLGKVHIAYPPFWASDNVLVISPLESQSFHFCFLWITSIDVHALNRGSTQPLLTQKDLGNQLHVTPNNSVLKEFSVVVNPIYEKMHANIEQSQTLATLRDTLLPRLISGQLRLPE